MNKKDLTQAIEVGVYRAKTRRGKEITKDIVSGVFWGTGILIFGIIVIALWNGGGIDFSNKQTTSASKSIKCNYPYLSCNIKSRESSYICHTDGSKVIRVFFSVNEEKLKNMSLQEEICEKIYPTDIKSSLRFCSYQEAQAFYSIYKDSYEGNSSNLFMECQ